ncbi:MAG: hypothetical protein DSY80_00295, partial [Desulfocapsa sp.]
LTRDPELRALPSGQNVCSFSLATNRVYKDKDGKKQEQGYGNTGCQPQPGCPFERVVVFPENGGQMTEQEKKEGLA